MWSTSCKQIRGLSTHYCVPVSDRELTSYAFIRSQSVKIMHLDRLCPSPLLHQHSSPSWGADGSITNEAPEGALGRRSSGGSSPELAKGTSGGPLCHLQACIGRHKRWGSCHRSGSDDAHGLVQWLQLEDRVSQREILERHNHAPPQDEFNKPPAVISHPVKPAPSLGVARRVNHPQQGLMDGLHPGEFEDAAFKPAHPMCLEIPSVDQRLHAHRDDEPRRTSSEQPLWEAMLAVLKATLGHMTYSMNALRRAGIVPCHSGKTMTNAAPKRWLFVLRRDSRADHRARNPAVCAEWGTQSAPRQ